MTNNHRNRLISLFLVSQILLVVIGGIQANDSYKKLKLRNLFFMRNFNVSNAINEILSSNWTENHKCLVELNAIKSGVNNYDEWAIKCRWNFYKFTLEINQ